MVDGTGVVFDDVADQFTGNFYESCFMANQDGIIKIVASGIKKKTENNCDYFCASVTILSGGNCFGKRGPLIFLSKGNMVGSKNTVNLSPTKSCHPTLM